MKAKLKKFIENRYVNDFILFVIIFNSIVLGLLTYPHICEHYGKFLQDSCVACVIIFTIEIFIKLFVYGKSFFKDGWNNFDFILIAISWVPTGGAFSSLRAFRVLRALRALRLVVRLRKLRIIVQAILESIPNVAWACVLLLLIFYIFAIMGTTMFAESYPEFFGTIGKSMFSLFQIMTLDDWATGITRPILQQFSAAWLYFVTFVLISSFIVMNVIVGVVVNAIGELNENMKKTQEIERIKKSTDLEIELGKLKKQIALVEELLQLEKQKN